MGFRYSGSGYDDSRLAVISEGEQSLMIESIEEKESKSGNPMLMVTLRKDDKHYKIRHYITLNNEWTTKNIGDLLSAVGEDPKSDRMIEWSSLKGDWLDAKIVHEDYNGNPQAKVKYFISGKSKKSGAPQSSQATPSKADDEVPF